MQRLGTYSIATGRGDDRVCRMFDGVDASGCAVILKLIHPHLIVSESIRSALRDQMRALVDVREPTVLRHLDLVEEGDQLALVVEVPQGETLRQRLTRVQRLSWPEAVSVAVEIARGLAAVHAASPALVHGDLRPENILLSHDGAKLVDFDFTWTVKDAQGESTAGFRNLRYMSPEAIDAAGVEPRSDLYGLGLVLYEMLSGTPPFSASSPRDLLNAQCTQAPPPLSPTLRSELPTGLEALIGRLLEKRKEARPASAVEVIGYLEGIRRGQPDSSIVGTGPPMIVAGDRAPSSGRSAKPRVLPLVLGAAVVLALGTGGVAYLVLGGDETAARRDPVTSEQQASIEPDLGLVAPPKPSPTADPRSVNVDDAVDTPLPAAPDAAQEEALDDDREQSDAPAADEESGGEESEPSALASVFEELAAAREAAEREPAASEPTRAQKIASWVDGRLTGHDNRMAALRAVRITKSGSGHEIFIRNQFQWTCKLDFDSSGSPSRLRNCKSGDPPWNTPTNPIKLECSTDENRERCRGSYRLKSKAGPGAGSAETMQIIRRLPKPKN